MFCACGCLFFAFVDVVGAKDPNNYFLFVSCILFFCLCQCLFFACVDFGGAKHSGFFEKKFYVTKCAFQNVFNNFVYCQILLCILFLISVVNTCHLIMIHLPPLPVFLFKD